MIRPRFRFTTVSAYGLIGFLTSAILNVAARLGTFELPPGHPVFFGLSLAIAPLFVAFVLKARQWRRPGSRPLGARTRLHWPALRPYFPWWVRPLGVALVLYAIVNFYLVAGTSRVRVTMEGSSLPPRETLIAFSGHWMLFFGLPTIFFGFVPWGARPRDDALPD